MLLLVWQVYQLSHFLGHYYVQVLWVIVHCCSRLITWDITIRAGALSDCTLLFSVLFVYIWLKSVASDLRNSLRIGRRGWNLQLRRLYSPPLCSRPELAAYHSHSRRLTNTLSSSTVSLRCSSVDFERPFTIHFSFNYRIHYITTSMSINHCGPGSPCKSKTASLSSCLAV